MALPALLANYVNYGDGSTTGHYAVLKWALSQAITVGLLIRQKTAPAVGSERVFVAIVAGTADGATEPTWILTRGAKTAEASGTGIWQECTGQPATNGDLTNTRTWTSSHAATSSPSLGVIVKDASNNLFIVTTAGGADSGAEPTWNTTVGVTTTDGSVTWTCIHNGAYTGGSAPHARLANAFTATWGAAGDDFYVGDIHAETQAANITLTSPGTVSAPCRILCVLAAGTYPPVSSDLRTTATITTTVSSASITYGGFYYYYGITFNANGANGNSHSFSANSALSVLNSCQVKFGSGNTSNLIIIGSIGGSTASIKHTWINTTINCVSQASTSLIRLGQAEFMWLGTASAVAGTAPTSLFFAVTGGAGRAYLQGVDLSLLGSGKNLVSVAVGSIDDFKFNDCKLGASVAVTTGTHPGHGGPIVRVVNCDSADTQYRYAFTNYNGTITQETTIVRTGGANDGVTAFSRKFVTSANTKFYSPLVGPWFYFWNPTIGSITMAIETVTDNVTLTDADAWVEVEYQGTSGVPFALFANDAAADILNTGTAQTTSTALWPAATGTPVKQVMSKTVTTAEVGWIRARLVVARVTTTVYACPKVLTGSPVQYMDENGDIFNEAIPLIPSSVIMQPAGMI